MNRRKFIHQGGLVSLGLLAGTSTLKAFQFNGFSKETINIGVIGTGGRGIGQTSLINKIENLEVVAVCDILPFRLKEGLKATNNTAKAYTKYNDLINDKNVDAVLIATPFSEHYKMAMDALNADKHVYCEKTMAKGLVESENLVYKVSTTNLIFQAGHQYHSSRLYTHVVGMLKEDVIGNIKSFECRWYRKGDWRKPIPEAKYEKNVNWRMYREFSGGLTAELSSHQIDFVNWVLDENPKKIMGTGGVNFWNDGRETFDNTHLIFEYPSGVKAQFKCLTSNIPGGYQIKVIGDKGVITLTTNKAWINYYKKPEKVKYADVDGVSGATVPKDYNDEKGTPINVVHSNPSEQALIDFKESIFNNKQPISNVETGANTAKAVQLAIDAMLTGKVQYW
ncbi:twin-arginine translocation pathway signal [Algibacter lectus]|uniref:Twin-arginine translocation pathway signal n=1 Tax=Algibacter lectus TaxID=221126 RepID=A0A090X647_9FLAO|nr:Gfo/Idh/MocA family oxidoreductase [Algibacter lectus]GAL80652.1 twin-arginine translocation pathway signal [Algibacter lectus]